jgi:hypothetical protein
MPCVIYCILTFNTVAIGWGFFSAVVTRLNQLGPFVLQTRLDVDIVKSRDYVSSAGGELNARLDVGT